MKPSILVVMLDFLVCSLLLFVIGTGGKQTRYATSAPPARTVVEEYSPAALQTLQEEWNRDYDQQALLAQLDTQTTENEQLRTQLNQTTTTLATREANLRALAEEKARVEEAKAQTERALTSIESQLTKVTAERQRLQQEGAAAKESLAQLQTQQTKLLEEKTELRERAAQLDKTVASQQATISSLSENVAASQARIESQFSDFARDQQRMATTLTQLDEFTRTLPVAIQDNVTTVRDEQQNMQDDLAALTEAVRGLQADLENGERTPLLQAVADVARGQQDLQSRLDTLIKTGQGPAIAQSLTTIQTGQDALREQAAKLADQIETIKARSPGPFKAVRNARAELALTIKKRDNREATIAQFNATVFPPVVRVADRVFLIASLQSLGLRWRTLSVGSENTTEIIDLKYIISRRGESSWSAALTMPICLLQAEPRIASLEVNSLAPEIQTLELAGADAVLQSDVRKLHVFKTSAAGLSFVIDTAPDLSDPRYLVIQRPLRGVAAWFENPAYRADAGDYVVNGDGKLVGLMVSRDRCFLLSPDTLLNCAATVPLADKEQFDHAVRQLPRVK